MSEFVVVLGATFAVAAFAITFNTVRPQILTARNDIELARLIGAARGYIRRPFLYFSGLQGLLGGVATFAIVTASMRRINAALNDFSIAYGTTIGVEPGPPGYTSRVVASTAAAGRVATWLAASRRLWARQSERDR